MRWIGPVIFAALLAFTWVIASSGGIQAVWAWIFVTGVWPFVGALVLLVVAIVSLIRWRVTSTRAASALLALPAVWPLGWGFGLPALAFPASLQTSVPAITVRLPSDQKLRVIWGGHDVSTNQHALSPAQRWAYDLVVDPAVHGGKALEGYGCFGTPVLAPIAGRVHMAQDGESDLGIGETLANPAALLGNHVVLELETKTYLVIAHLKNGSVTVKPGDQVSEGQVIGACGNSGNTSEPHIHIHHQRQDPLAFGGELNAGVNVAEGLPLYFRGHGGPAMPKGGVKVEGGKTVPTGDYVQHQTAP